MEFSKTDREAFIQTVQDAQTQNQDNDIRKKKSRLAAAKKRIADVKRLLDKIYGNYSVIQSKAHKSRDMHGARCKSRLNSDIAKKQVTGQGTRRRKRYRRRPPLQLREH